MVTTSTQRPTYRFFNTGDGWPGLGADGVTVDADGRLGLVVVPGVDPAGQVCLPVTTETTGPRGYRYVVQPAAGTVSVVDPPSGQTIAVWGPFAGPSYVVGDANAVFLVEAEARAVTRLDAEGIVDESWWAAVSAWSGPVVARGIELVELGTGARVVVLADAADEGTRILVADLDGAQDETAGAAWNLLEERRRDPRTGRWQVSRVGALTGLAVDVAGGRLVVVAQGDVLCFDLAGRWIGRAETPDGWRSRRVFAVPGPCDSTRYVVTGVEAGDALVLDPLGAWARLGTFVCGPISTGAMQAAWGELRARTMVPAGGGLRLWTLASFDDVPPDPDSIPGDLSAPSALAWTPLPGDPRGALVGSEPSSYLWLGGLLTGDGRGTPTVEQVRVDVATGSWLSYLPPLYAEPGPSAEFLDRMLRWLQSDLRDNEELLDQLPARFDPRAADDTATGTARTTLDELAGWLGVTLDEQWPESRRRAVTAEAHRLHAMRGTAGGLERLLSLRLDAPVAVLDPPDSVSLWVLDDVGGPQPALGLTTRLASSAPGGAVVDSTAIPGGSTLSDGTDYGAPLYEAGAHRFCVQAYAADLPEQADQDELRRLVDAEKPAHLVYHLCLIDAAARVGFQARVGVDAIVAGPAGDLVLDAGAGLGVDSTLDRTGSPDPGRSVRVGTAALGKGLQLT
ncbi:phage tail-like protein [Kribbella steppae]|uniref:Phage tail-like protein n=1 Tax=Kribbella steppae TaxID=2512223 RepID=A0A4R2GZV0_9ACTN|nr:phage tail protein [Kribbella steppae]TCO17181.1 phage tail-like protein [Kribbella steppae]